jgi:hypothetical protein
VVALYNALIDGIGILSDRLEALLRWTFAYPIYPLQLLIILLVGTGNLGREVGAEQLFWKYDFLDQFGVGLFVCLLFCTTFYVEYLLNRPTWLMRWLPGPTLLPSQNPEVRALGRYLFWGIAAGLVVLYTFKGIAIDLVDPDSTTARFWTSGFWTDARLEYLHTRHWLYPFALGYGFAIVFIECLFVLDELPFWAARKNQIREWLLDQPIVLDRHLHLSTPRELLVVELTRRTRTSDERFTPAMLSLHGIGIYMTIVAVVVLSGFLIAIIHYDSGPGGEYVWTPVALVSSILVLLTLVYGVITYFVHTQRLILAVAVLALMCWNSSDIFSDNDYKYRFPGLTYERDRLTVLWDSSLAARKGKDADLYTDVLLKNSQGYANDHLIDSELPLRAMSARWQESHGGRKPKVIFICTSGGGIRAAVWTGVVLGKLENQAGLKENGFRDNLRMFTGASGGMVAAALYAADFDNGRLEVDGRNSNPLVEVLAQDSLSRTAQSLVLRDMVRNVFVPPWSACEWDRGRTLEWKWGLIAQSKLGRDPFSKTFQSLRGERPKDKLLATTGRGEWAGMTPSVVFSPMLIEDSRRLLISNLDLSGPPPYETSIAHSFGPGATGQLQVSAVEFHRLFPDFPPSEFERQYGHAWSGATSETFTVGTAARMSATFPIISPAVSLPTNPRRRVVDAGYYDNYGMDLTALWIWKHRAAIRSETSGFAVIEIRAFPLQDSANRFAATDPQTGKPDPRGGTGDLFTDSAAAISAPMDAILTARGNVQRYRNAELVEFLSKEFADCDRPGAPFFYNVWFELDRPASLNWYLSDQEKQNVLMGFNKYARAASQLAEWYQK